MTRPSLNLEDFRAFLSVLFWSLAPGDLIGFGSPRSVQAFALSVLRARQLRSCRTRYITNAGICHDLGRRSHARRNAAVVSCLALDVDDPVAHASTTAAALVEAALEQLEAVVRRMAEETGAAPAMTCYTGGGGLVLFKFSRALNPYEYRAFIDRLAFLSEISDSSVLRPANLVRAIGTWHYERNVQSRVLATHEGVPLDADDLLDGLDVPEWKPPEQPTHLRHPRPRGGDVERGRQFIRDFVLGQRN